METQKTQFKWVTTNEDFLQKSLDFIENNSIRKYRMLVYNMFDDKEIAKKIINGVRLFRAYGREAYNSSSGSVTKYNIPVENFDRYSLPEKIDLV